MATYSSLGPDDIDAIGRWLGHGLTDVRPLSGGMANSSFRACAGGEELVVTVLDDHDVASAERLSAFMAYLDAQGLPVQHVRPGVDGRTILVLDGKPVIIKQWIDGHHEDPLPLDRLAEVGRILASIHEVPTPTFLDGGERRLPADWREVAGADAPADLIALIERAVELEPEMDPLPVGLVHGDLFADNLLVASGGELVVLDWETATAEAFVVDLGTSAMALCRTDNRLDAQRLDAMSAGYDEVRPLRGDERDALPTAIECATALFAWQRYVRHNVFRPDPAQAHIHEELVEFGESLRR